MTTSNSANSDIDTRFALAPGVDVVRLGEAKVMLRSGFSSLVLEGKSSVAFAERLLPMFDGTSTVREVADAAGTTAEDLVVHATQLAKAGLLRRCDRENTLAIDALFDGLGLPRERTIDRLARSSVALFGSAALGTTIAGLLLDAGLGHLELIDPYPDGSAGLRQDGALTVLEQSGHGARVKRPLTTPLDQASVARAIEGMQFVIGACDRGLSVAHHWINRAVHPASVPALFVTASGVRATIGPLVLPGETACLMCWRMRALATVDDFEHEMAYEEYLDRRRTPDAVQRPTFPGIALLAASVAATEILKIVLGLGVPKLTNAVATWTPLDGELAFHPVLPRPDCPVCSKKNASARSDRRGLAAGVASLSTPRGLADHRAVASLVVDRTTGIVRTIKRLMKDPGEPRAPFIVRAELSNARFLNQAERSEQFAIASGKGFTVADAERSALGEALERYSASIVPQSRIVHAQRAALPGASLDPHALVLFAPEQYAHVKYAPWQEDTAIGWIEGRALAEDRPLYVPALGALMAYDVPRHEEFLFPATSNGLAAGRSFAHAILQATLEVLERDAFLATWMHSLPATRIDAAEHPDVDVRSLVAAYARRGVSLELWRLPTDHTAIVMMAIGFQDEGSGPAAVVGLGCSLDASDAARGAVLEVGQVRPGLKMRLHDPASLARLDELIADPGGVAALDEHDLLYAAPQMSDAFAFLRERPVEAIDWSPSAPASDEDRLAVLLAALRRIGADIVQVDLTSDDVRALGVHVARAIVPHFQPIHFGHREARLGGDRLFGLPQRLGFADRRAMFADLNRLPHPLA